MTTNANTTSTRKRTHLKPDQVALLQESFNSNALPDSSVRGRLARELNVTERTIQIWFQNRRAKARKVETEYHHYKGKSVLKPGWMETYARHLTPPRYQTTFRTMMTPERFEELKQYDSQQIRKRPRSVVKAESKPFDFISHRALSDGQVAETPTQLIHLPVNVLRIGTWTRFAHASVNTNQSDWDLVCYSNPFDRELVWRVQAEGHHFRIQAGFDVIHQISLGQQIQVETGEIVGQIDIQLNLPLTFSMWRFDQDNQWVRCGDFTEDKQATMDGLHILQGNYDAFRQSLLDLITLAPELVSKTNFIPINDLTQPPPGLDVCRDFTVSPSATPEPYMSMCPFGINPQHLSKTNMSHLMLQAPFFYPNTGDNSQVVQQPMYSSV
ncbi:uncharacterized protein EV154DRAFT_516017 [Mucor mucedo]|uniref:uncharacterized protein n=1 Tax=Mucor mucedo TaxID=29922 RepID=UPI00221F909F|nr:uncharacterized protein EV154DRAFT_516017 [Mucor mucedo]KAI7888945.1 hypothetical protein EV154DRAFT_516017 [Mucor mucedo]